MSVAISNQAQALIQSCDKVTAEASTGAELFGLVDLLIDNPQLCRGLFDSNGSLENRRDLARQIFSENLGEPACEILDAALTVNWNDPREALAALEVQALRVQLRCSEADIDEITQQLAALSRAVRNSPELMATITDQTIDLDARRDLISELVPSGSPETVSLLARRAINSVVFGSVAFSENLRNYATASADIRGRQLALTTVAKPLSDRQRQSLSLSLERLYERPTDLLEIIDPEVIGGVRVEIGDEVIDGTIRAKLNEAEHAVQSLNEES